MHPSALGAALRAADGDHNRLWFDADGGVWTLNHSRDTTCISAACPMCAPKRRAS